MEAAIDKSRNPKVAGIIDIILGILLVLLGIGGALYVLSCSRLIDTFMNISEAVIVSLISLFLFVIGGLATRGGVYALERKKWVWAVTGAIYVVSPVIGIPALILVTRSKNV